MPSDPPDFPQFQGAVRTFLWGGLHDLCLGHRAYTHECRLRSLQASAAGRISRCYQPGATDHFSLRGTAEKAGERFRWYDHGAMQFDHWQAFQLCVSFCIPCRFCFVIYVRRPEPVMWRLTFTETGYKKFLTSAWLVEMKTSDPADPALGTALRAAAVRPEHGKWPVFVHA